MQRPPRACLRGAERVIRRVAAAALLHCSPAAATVMHYCMLAACVGACCMCMLASHGGGQQASPRQTKHKSLFSNVWASGEPARPTRRPPTSDTKVVETSFSSWPQAMSALSVDDERCGCTYTPQCLLQRTSPNYRSARAIGGTTSKQETPFRVSLHYCRCMYTDVCTPLFSLKGSMPHAHVHALAQWPWMPSV